MVFFKENSYKVHHHLLGHHGKLLNLFIAWYGFFFVMVYVLCIDCRQDLDEGDLHRLAWVPLLQITVCWIYLFFLRFILEGQVDIRNVCSILFPAVMRLPRIEKLYLRI